MARSRRATVSVAPLMLLPRERASQQINDVASTESHPDIRRALAVRDQGLRVPGYDTPGHRCDAHHQMPWWAGGATRLDDLVLLCPHHHARVEPPRWWRGPPPDRWTPQFTDADFARRRPAPAGPYRPDAAGQPQPRSRVPLCRLPAGRSDRRPERRPRRPQHRGGPRGSSPDRPPGRGRTAPARIVGW